MADLYDALGLTKTASKDEIRKAYRTLAKQCHPDLFPGDEEAEARFKRISAAYDILSDDEKRRRYDAGEIDEAGHERPPRQYYRDFADADGRGAGYTMGDEELGDIFAEIFGAGMGPGEFGGARGRRRAFKAKGQDVSYSLPIEFLEAANGTKKRVTMPDGRTLDISIPKGAHDRQMLRLKGQGMPGIGGGPPGDAYIEIHVRPHGVFTRKDENIHIELPITIDEAVLGGKVQVPTIDGPVTMTIAPGANTGDTLRLKGKGIAAGSGKSARRGDQYVKLKVVLPDAVDDELKSFLQDWRKSHRYDPRKGMTGVRA